jgi:succinate-semialdehyde dehydrogenase / glutarate-semialdehyde dehydrogenase
MTTASRLAPTAHQLGLSDPELLREACLIDGEWVAADSGAFTEIVNPSTGKLLGTVPDCGRAETARAIDAAEKARHCWATKPAEERARILKRWFALCMAAQEDLGRLITLEQGKPIAEARGEIAYGSSFIEWFAEEARRVYGDVIPGPAGRRILVLKQPVGVVAAITPWNFPNAMITRKVGAALAAGCTIVVKPAPATPYSALAIAWLAERAGLPKGALNIVTGDAKAIGAEMTGNHKVRKISFTGSTEVGKLLLRNSAETVKKVSLELGGNAPFIIFADADLDLAIKGVVASKFRNAGQTCVCANRIFVEDRIYEAFAEKLKEAVAVLKVGDGFEEGVTIGPLINQAAVYKVDNHISDALARGAKIMIGGKSHPRGGLFYEPTILTDVDPTSRLMREEVFGPVAPLIRFSDESSVIARANDTESGLAAYVYTRDLARSWRICEALEFGIVALNEGIVSTAAAPFGGMKQSGLGREGSKYGIDEYVEIKYICVGGLG